jgi:alpha-beta hydrolase superfamily lysophospholipase
MREASFTLTRPGAEIYVYHWLPAEGIAPRGVVQIAHGMAEHAARYSRFAEALTAAGFVVYANDHRGHGRTAKTLANRGIFAEQNGWRTVIDDLYAVWDRAATDHPGLPHVLFAHSMGAFMAQHVMFERGNTLKAVALSGTTSGISNPLAPIGRLIARLERWRLGARSSSSLLTKLSFGEFNRAFSPARTEYDWLSRDAAEVDRYIADSWCGFEVSTQLWIDLLDALPTLADANNLQRVPRELPVYVLTGSADPIHNKLKGLHRLVNDWSAVGLRDITWKVHEQGRHETLNDIHRDEATAHFLQWLDRVMGLDVL